jgi:hypothetical protein
MKILQNEITGTKNSFSTNFGGKLRVTLDEGPRPRDQWIQAILLVESLKLVPSPSDKGPRPKSGKLRLNLRGTLFWRENQLVQTKKTMLKGELLIWKTKSHAKDQFKVQLKDSICFNSVQIGS